MHQNPTTGHHCPGDQFNLVYYNQIKWMCTQHLLGTSHGTGTEKEKKKKKLRQWGRAERLLNKSNLKVQVEETGAQN